MAATFRGQRELNKRLRAVAEGHGIMRRLQIDATAEAKRLVPRKTGNLGRSIRPGFLSDREALVHAHANYAAFVELGTRPHTIRAKRAKSLRFPASGVSTTLSGRVRTGEVRALGNNAFVFAKVVHHPGTKPRPFLVPGAKKALEKSGLRDVVIQLWNRAA